MTDEIPEHLAHWMVDPKEWKPTGILRIRMEPSIITIHWISMPYGNFSIYFPKRHD